MLYAKRFFTGRIAAMALSFAFCISAPIGGALAEGVDGDVLLRISFVDGAGAGAVREFDRDALQALEPVEIVTTSAWTEGEATFRGPLMRDVLAAVGAEGSVILATAANDYAVEIPIDDFTRFDVVLAMEMDGRPLSLRDFGPLWIVYPRDDHEELFDPVMNARWIWQLTAIDVR